MSRDSIGRYVQHVTSARSIVLRDTKEIAIKRFEPVERRLPRSTELYKQYKLFMKEYLELGHMEEVLLSRQIIPQ